LVLPACFRSCLEEGERFRIRQTERRQPADLRDRFRFMPDRVGESGNVLEPARNEFDLGSNRGISRRFWLDCDGDSLDFAIRRPTVCLCARERRLRHGRVGPNGYHLGRLALVVCSPADGLVRLITGALR
jgi:hypothetical protein